MNKPKLHLRHPIFPDLLIRNGGCLPDEIGAHACWYYYTLAQKIYEKIGDSTEDQFGLLETDLWLDPHYHQLARSIATLYRLESPDSFMKFREPIARQAAKLGYPEPKNRYMNPMRLVIN